MLAPVKYTNANFHQFIKVLSYTTSEVPPTTKEIKVINQKEFAAAVLDSDEEVLVFHIVSLSPRFKVEIYPAQKAKIAILDTKKVIFLLEYSDLANVLLEASAIELPEHYDSNDYLIDLVDDK